VQANVTAIKQYHFITVNTTSGLFREAFSITATAAYDRIHGVDAGTHSFR